MSQPLFISDYFIKENTDYPVLIERLKTAFNAGYYSVPQRNIYNTTPKKDAPQLFTMPAFGSESLGVKIVTIHPENRLKHLPTINKLLVQ